MPEFLDVPEFPPPEPLRLSEVSSRQPGKMAEGRGQREDTIVPQTIYLLDINKSRAGTPSGTAAGDTSVPHTPRSACPGI